MKAGTDDTNKTRLAIALFVVAALVALYEFWPSSHTETAYVPPPTAKGSKATPVFSRLDPSLRLDLLKGSEQVSYQGSGRDIFHAQAEAPKEVAEKVGDVRTGNNQGTQGPAVHTNPPIPLKFYGYASASNRKQIFLAQGEDVFVVKEGDIVKGRYKIVHVNPNNVEVQDVLGNYSQQIPLSIPNS